jgi:hypothetical protein
MAGVALVLTSLAACARNEGPSASLFPSRAAETEAYVRAIEAGMAHAERVQEMRRSAARREWRP